ncbi:hypothetical protein BJY04DRAFT_179359 [Aspergillus karnatakaensis]|uniref:uncharacterized protein n=1 Tax=Aspergillus karnatakaensis TaxID=1810916 RepID=UPI003CCE2BC3
MALTSQDQPEQWVFITTSPAHQRPTKAQRSQARQRVMREIGASRRKEHEKACDGAVSTLKNASLDSSSDVNLAWNGSHRSRTAVALSAYAPSFEVYPITLDDDSRWLLQHMFSGAIPSQSRVYLERWYPLCITNAAAFHQMLATYATHVSLAGHNHSLNELILTNHTKALAGVRSYLDSQPIIDKYALYGAVSAVTALACYSHLSMDVLSWQLHTAALCQLVNGLGFGLANLDAMVKSLIQWVESIGSYAFDIAPTLGDPQSGALQYRRSLDELLPPSLSSLTFHKSLISAYQALRQINTQLYSRTSILGTSTWDNQAEINQLTYPLIYELLSLNQATHNLSPLSCCLRYAALLYLAEFRRKTGVCPVVTDLHIQGLRYSLETVKQGSPSPELKAWLLTVGAMEANFLPDKQYFYNRLSCTLWDLQVDSVLHWKQYLEETVWLGGLFDEKLYSIWNAVVHKGPDYLNVEAGTK